MNFTYSIDRNARTVDFYIGTTKNHTSLNFDQAIQLCEDILEEINKLEEEE